MAVANKAPVWFKVIFFGKLYSMLVNIICTEPKLRHAKISSQRLVLRWLYAFALFASIAAPVPAAAQALELVMYDRPGCVWCVRWERDIGRSYARTQEAERAPLRRVDIRDQRRAGVTLEEPVVYTPTFVLSADGVEIGRITGYPGEDMFWDVLDDLLRQSGQSYR